MIHYCHVNKSSFISIPALVVFTAFVLSGCGGGTNVPSTTLPTASSQPPVTTTAKPPSVTSQTPTTPPPVQTTAPQITSTPTETTDTLSSLNIIADFESAPPLSNWSFGGGQGTNAELTTAQGYVGSGGKLAYNFTGEPSGERYAWASCGLNPPISPSMIAFWVNAPPGITVKLDVQDSTGQSLQYTLRRPFNQINPDSWYRYSVELDTAPEYWGGRNDGVLHGQVTAIVVVAAALRGYASSGELLFDDIEALDDTSFNVDPSLISVTPVPGELGSLSSRLGVNIHFPVYPNYIIDERALDLAQAAGFTWVRMDFPWADVYKGNSVYDFGNQDRLVAAAEARGMKVIFILNFGHELFTGAWNIQPTTPSAIKAFGDYAYEAAKHYTGHAVVWEVWNEPNIANFWPPAPNVAQYTALLKETVQSLQEGNPDARIITGGLSGYDYTFLESYLDTGSAVGASGIGIHPYGLLTPEEVSDYTLLMRAIIKETLVANPPVWDTEWGYSSTYFGDGNSTGARTQQAIMVCRELISAWAVGFPLIIYYDIRDDGTDPKNSEQNFGLLANDYSDKTTMQAVRTLTKFTGNRVMTGMVNTNPSSLHMLMIEGQNDTGFIAWSDIEGGQVEVVIPPTASATDYLGNPLSAVTNNQGQVITVSESDGPVYITIPN
jgi:polysaccharide biosynthesis protein PslG